MTLRSAWKRGLYEWHCRIFKSARNGNKSGYIFCIKSVEHYVPFGKAEEFFDIIASGKPAPNYGHSNRLRQKYLEKHAQRT